MPRVSTVWSDCRCPKAEHFPTLAHFMDLVGP